MICHYNHFCLMAMRCKFIIKHEGFALSKENIVDRVEYNGNGLFRHFRCDLLVSDGLQGVSRSNLGGGLLAV